MAASGNYGVIGTNGSRSILLDWGLHSASGSFITSPSWEYDIDGNLVDQIWKNFRNEDTPPKRKDSRMECINQGDSK